MKIPSVEMAETLLEEARRKNPGPWIEHSRVAGLCAKKIASQCGGMDENAACALGLLHDIGRRDGLMDMRHIYCGYQFMIAQGYDDSARICLTHSFPYKHIGAYSGENDCAADETFFIERYLEKAEYDEYDRLIQLCDALSFPEGPVYMEKRFVNVAIRRGFNEWTIPKWKAFFELKSAFDKKAGVDLYGLLQVR